MNQAMQGHQDERVIVKSSDKMWSTGEENGNPLLYSCLENHMDSMKSQKDMMREEVTPRSLLLLLGNSRGQLLIAPVRMKKLGQRGNNTQLCMCLVVKVKSEALKNIAQESGMLGPWIKIIWM